MKSRTWIRIYLVTIVLCALGYWWFHQYVSMVDRMGLWAAILTKEQFEDYRTALWIERGCMLTGGLAAIGLIRQLTKNKEGA